MILIISAPNDIHAQAVMRELARQGAQQVHLLNLSEFPMQMDLTMQLGASGGHDFTLTCADRTSIHMEQVSAVWWRRPQPFTLPANLTDPAYRHFALAEAATAFQGMWQASDALWVNNVARDAAASHKPWQLALAQEISLAIPETLITNNPDQARQFWARFPDEIIYKPFSANYHAWRETRLLKQEEHALADTIRLAPVIFQRYVPAIVDLRVTIVGEQIFAAEAHSQQGEYKVDVRFNTDIAYKPHTLPIAVADKLLSLMRRLGLEYGAIDVRLTPEGEYVFLEINPAGQFLYVEQATGQPIAAALAQHLARGVSAHAQPVEQGNAWAV